MPLRSKDLLPGLAATAMLVGCSTSAAQSSASEATPEAAAVAAAGTLTFADAFTLKNDTVELTIAPSVGRIVGFGPIGGPNLLWLNSPEKVAEAKQGDGWVNYGGDKIWPALQAMWGRILPHGGGFPPDTTIDGSAWDVTEQSPRRVVMQSPVSPYMGIRVIRVIELPEQGPTVNVHSTIERVEPSVFPVIVWAVAQVPQSNYALLGVTRRFPQGPKGLEHRAHFGRWSDDKVGPGVTPLADGNAIRWDFKHQGGGKVGTLGTWCAAVYDDWAVVHQTPFDPAGSFPDASNIQVYTHGEYVELETLGSQFHLQPGEKTSQLVVWTLLPVEGRDDAALVEAIEKLPAP